MGQYLWPEPFVHISLLGRGAGVERFGRLVLQPSGYYPLFLRPRPDAFLFLLEASRFVSQARDLRIQGRGVR